MTVALLGTVQRLRRSTIPPLYSNGNGRQSRYSPALPEKGRGCAVLLSGSSDCGYPRRAARAAAARDSNSLIRRLVPRVFAGFSTVYIATGMWSRSPSCKRYLQRSLRWAKAASEQRGSCPYFVAKSVVPLVFVKRPRWCNGVLANESRPTRRCYRCVVSPARRFNQTGTCLARDYRRNNLIASIVSVPRFGETDNQNDVVAFNPDLRRGILAYVESS